jgi:probable rRNA maturation factor
VSAALVEVVNLTRAGVDEAAVAALCAAVLAAEGAGGAEVGVRFVGEGRMRTLNREHRGIDQVTDVLSFPLEEAGEWDDAWDDGPSGDTTPAEGDDAAADGDDAPPRLLGDVVVCPRVAARQARRDGLPAARELAVLLVHGILHLLGHDHEVDAGEMIHRQEELLADLPWEGLLVESR